MASIGLVVSFFLLASGDPFGDAPLCRFCSISAGVSVLCGCRAVSYDECPDDLSLRVFVAGDRADGLNVSPFERFFVLLGALTFIKRPANNNIMQ